MSALSKAGWSEGVSIIVPTFRRPEGIAIALKSLQNQTAAGRKLEIIVADNDPKAGARDYITSFAKTSDIPVIYTHVPEPGVSNARNGAMKLARGRFIVFLDDDMEATEGWVEQFLNTAKKYKAGLVFLPAVAVMPDEDDPLNSYMQPFFSRTLDAPEGVTEEYLGTGGCLLDLRVCDLSDPPFDTSRNEIGGEDDLLFASLVQQGVTIAWSDKVVAYEHVPPSRATPAYLWTRNFAFGQGPTQSAADKGLGGLFEIIKWMCVGVAQTLVYAPLYLGLRLLRRPAYMKYMAKTAQGVGKIFWSNGLAPRLYGTAALKKSKE